MKIQRCSVENTNRQDNTAPKMQRTPAFKSAVGAGALNAAGGMMQWIENQGFLASFLIQDALGMTAPRVGAGFLRDKEVTGQYNMQEGFEVLGREGLTGPCMMAVAPIMLGIAAFFGKTTSVNSQLIKRFGNSLKNIIAKPEFDKTLLNNKDKFKEVFYETNIRDMLSNTLGKENVKEELVADILKEIQAFETNPKSKKEGMKRIIEKINNAKYSTGDDLEVLDKLKIANGDKIGTYSIKDSIDAMIKYSNDAISLNKNLDKLDEAAAEDIKNSSIAKRMITNISTMAATLGVLAVLPKLYIRSSVAPGARTAMQMKEAKEAQAADENQKQGEISFKGKESGLGKLGKAISKLQKNEKVASELEYDGHNFTHTLMAGLSLFGLLLPRGLRAYNRAQVDDNGKKDMSEIYEILIRDVSSSLAVVFAVPMLTRAFVSSYENHSGFVLMNKDRNMSKTKKFMDVMNPYSGSHVMTNTEISSLYNGIDSKEKMLNFCKYIDRNNGDLQKIISKSEFADTVFNDKTFKLADIANLDKKEKNRRITEFFEKNNISSDEITKLMKGKIIQKGNKTKQINKVASFARGLNSIPAVIATAVISPVILGWIIPRLTYANTRRLHAKAEEEKAKNINTAA